MPPSRPDRPSEQVPEQVMGIVLLSGCHTRAHAAFGFAAAAAALGRVVVLFATGPGCRALLKDWSGVNEVGRDAVVRARGVAGLGELREQAVALDVVMIACESGLRSEALGAGALLPEARVAGIATFLEAVGNGPVLTF